MGIRSAINTNPALAKWVVGSVLLLGVGALGYQLLNSASGSQNQPARFQQAFFTPDEGKTLLEADESEVAPFSLGGREVVRAHLFDCGGKRTVGYLERHTTEGKRAAAAMSEQATKGPPNPDHFRILSTTGKEVKRPGDATWTSRANVTAASPITNFKCPDGSPASPITP